MPIVRVVYFAVLHLALAASVRAESSANDEAARKEAYWWRVGTPVTIDAYFRAAAALEPGKPIGEYEAYVLANAYFQVYSGLCGGAELPRDRGDHWEAATVVGYWGREGKPIIIEKKTGTTYSADMPKVVNPRDYLKHVSETKHSGPPTPR